MIWVFMHESPAATNFLAGHSCNDDCVQREFPLNEVCAHVSRETLWTIVYLVTDRRTWCVARRMVNYAKVHALTQGKLNPKLSSGDVVIVAREQAIESQLTLHRVR